jgi:cytochrome c biogenesis protein CcdA
MTDQPNPSAFGQVARNVIDLIELQFQLLSIDSQVARGKAVNALACLVIVAVLTGVTLTVLMIGVGHLIHEYSEWSLGVSMLAAGGIGILIITFFAVAAGLLLRAATAAMKETKSEFVENLKWLKAVVVSPSTAPRNTIRSETFATNAPNTP